MSRSNASHCTPPNFVVDTYFCQIIYDKVGEFLSAQNP